MYEDVLNWMYEREEEHEIEMKVTCAPHYYRIVKERGGTPKSAGCLAGKSFLFISHTGIAQPCGYLELPAATSARTASGRYGKGLSSSPVSVISVSIRANAVAAGSSPSAEGAGPGHWN